MIWVLIALLSQGLHSFANVMDNYFVNKLFKSPSVLVFYASFINLLFLPLIFIFQLPELPTLNLLPFYFLLGLTNVLYLYPYYKALENDDTSIVISLFSLGKILVPILAFLIVGEVLSLKQYLGFLVIIFSSSILTLNNHSKKFEFNKSLYYMCVVSFILAFEAVLYKYVFNNTNWITGFTWAVIASFIIILPTLLLKNQRNNVRKTFYKFRNKFHLFALEEFLTFGGTATATIAISLAPVTLVEGISGFSPIFVLTYAILLGRLFPKAFKEKIDGKSIIKKIMLFIIMIIGIVLITK